MATRVLSSNEGKAAVGQVKSILTDGLEGQINALLAQGNILSQPEVWDGSLAEQFRNDAWPAASNAMKACATALADLQSQIESITTNIMAAGGNG